MPRVKGGLGGRGSDQCNEFVPTVHQRQLVEQLAAAGVCVDAMLPMVLDDEGCRLGLAAFKTCFAQEIERGLTKANVEVANALFRNATEPTDKHPHGNTTAQIFWLKAQAGWSEKMIVSGPGEEGAHRLEVVIKSYRDAADCPAE